MKTFFIFLFFSLSFSNAYSVDEQTARKIEKHLSDPSLIIESFSHNTSYKTVTDSGSVLFFVYEEGTTDLEELGLLFNDDTSKSKALKLITMAQIIDQITPNVLIDFLNSFKRLKARATRKTMSAIFYRRVESTEGKYLEDKKAYLEGFRYEQRGGLKEKILLIDLYVPSDYSSYVQIEIDLNVDKFTQLKYKMGETREEMKSYITNDYISITYLLNLTNHSIPDWHSQELDPILEKLNSLAKSKTKVININCKSKFRDR